MTGIEHVRVELVDAIRRVGVRSAARRLRVNESYISRILNGRQNVSVETAAGMIERLRQSEDEF